MGTLGWPYPFKARPWQDLDAEFSSMASERPDFEHLSAIVKSVLLGGAERDLAAFTSLGDLMVRSTPLPEPPFDLVAVRSPISIKKVPSGFLLIEHLSLSGRNDQLLRPVAEAVPLFWRFVIEKFGVHPGA